ncbi:hypothetical protein DFS34DRAFT_13774 [Phlyctochytrium arcticum]|nr:hypothetical protein DFS34DRAFT_13774 [Phlyctochytrium arcticum]
MSSNSSNPTVIESLDKVTRIFFSPSDLTFQLTDQVRESPPPDVAAATVNLTTNENLADEDQPEQINYKIFQRLHAEKLILANEPLEYPPTSKGGTAVLYHTAGWKYPSAAFKDIQYSRGDPGGSNVVICHYLDEKVRRESKTCQGVKLCAKL